MRSQRITEVGEEEKKRDEKERKKPDGGAVISPHAFMMIASRKGLTGTKTVELLIGFLAALDGSYWRH